MELTEFLSSNKIEISEPILKFCELGEKRMAKSLDPLHEVSHIKRILSDLNLFLKHNKEVREQINFEILLPAIYWHDTWKAERNPRNPFKIMYYQIVEGRGSAKNTAKGAKKLGIDKKILREITYCIKKHSFFQVIKRKTLESKVLYDMDTLEVLSQERIVRAFPDIQTNKGLRFLLRKTKRIAFRKRLSEKYYFPWSKKEHDRRFPKFIESMEKFIWDKPKEKRKIKIRLPKLIKLRV